MKTYLPEFVHPNPKIILKIRNEIYSISVRIFSAPTNFFAATIFFHRPSPVLFVESNFLTSFFWSHIKISNATPLVTELSGSVIIPLHEALYVQISKLAICSSITSLIADGRFLDMMAQTFPDNLALITSAYELSFSICMMVGFELGGCLYEKLGFWAPLNITSELKLNDKLTVNRA